MDTALHLLAERQGYLTRPQILDHGYDDRTISGMLSHGVVERIGSGLFAPRPAYRELTPDEQHLVRCRAVASRFGDAVVFTHQSAALLLGLDVWGVDLRSVHVTRRDTGRGRRQAGVRHHVGAIEDDEVMEIDGLRVSTPARTVWDLAVAESVEPALVTADSALHRQRCHEDDLVELALRYTAWRGSRHAKSTLVLADGRSESVGETRLRLVFRRHGIPVPVLQLVVLDRGVVVGRSDFAWEGYRHLAEFDGLIKYVGGHDSDEAARIVVAEKRREDRLRSLGWGMSRFVWADLNGSAADRAMSRLRMELDRSRRLYLPVHD